MSDDVVRRLHQAASDGANELCAEAAQRIAELEAQLASHGIGMDDLPDDAGPNAPSRGDAPTPTADYWHRWGRDTRLRAADRCLAMENAYNHAVAALTERATTAESESAALREALLLARDRIERLAERDPDAAIELSAIDAALSGSAGKAVAEVVLPDLSEDQHEHLKRVSALQVSMDDLCPECGHRYGDHRIGGPRYCPDTGGTT